MACVHICMSVYRAALPNLSCLPFPPLSSPSRRCIRQSAYYIRNPASSFAGGMLVIFHCVCRPSYLFLASFLSLHAIRNLLSSFRGIWLKRFRRAVALFPPVTTTGHRRATLKRPAAASSMTSLLAHGGPRKLAQPPQQTKSVHLELYNNLNLTYNGLHAEDGCLVLFVPSGQLVSSPRQTKLWVCFRDSSLKTKAIAPFGRTC